MTNKEFEDILNNIGSDTIKAKPEEIAMYNLEQRIAFAEVVLERKRQTILWGIQSFDDPIKWLGILTEEVGEVAQAINETTLKNATKKEKGGLENIKKELVQVAAVAISAIEDINRKLLYAEKENK